jgi:hypothetical protein
MNEDLSLRLFSHQFHDVSYITVEGATDFAKDLGIGASAATELCKRGRTDFSQFAEAFFLDSLINQQFEQLIVAETSFFTGMGIHYTPPLLFAKSMAQTSWAIIGQRP